MKLQYNIVLTHAEIKGICSVYPSLLAPCFLYMRSLATSIALFYIFLVSLGATTSDEGGISDEPVLTSI